MLILLLLLIFLRLSEQSEDFDNAKILGFPRLLCSNKSLLFNFDTNIPFQGKISMMKKVQNPLCAQDFSANIQRNATFKVDLRQCMDVTFLNNGSRVFTGNLEIGFHPLVITSNDRLFSVKCIDNSYAMSHQGLKSKDRFCSHTIRLASRWESSTVFHVGDAVVHEWNCDFPVKEGLRYQTFLTSCNAVSSSGQVIHLVDENGCIVDSELIGEVVYNNFVPKVFARARVFKLMNDEKYRMECHVQMCSSEGVCKDRIFPPKCAFTKEEILNRYASKTKIDAIEDTFVTGTINNRYEQQVRVVSEWITVHNNQYTNIEQLQERFYLSAVIDEKLEEPKNQLGLHNHFLMGISYRSPNNTDFRRNETDDNELAMMALMGTPHAFLPQNPTVSTGEVDNIELASTTTPTPESTLLVTQPSTATLGQDLLNETVASTTAAQQETSTVQPPTVVPTVAKQANSAESFSVLPFTSTVQTSTDPSTIISSTTKEKTTNLTRTKAKAKSSSRTTTSPATTENTSTHSSQKTWTRTRGKPATILFYTDKSTSTILSTTTAKPQTPPQIFASEVSILENKIAQLSLGMDKSEDVTAEVDEIVPHINENDISAIAKEKFTNPRDWRLDDRTINDTDIMPERQVACSNATIIASQSKCSWTGVEHLLVVWSFASLLVWIVMIGVCFYRQTNKPAWMEYRERELQRMAQSRVLQHEHPWVHADAFEETRCKNKNELTMIQGTF
ncbi:Zona pellucida domain protein [Trichostrongylus colubriformis]|uniref:Zona pellucida domain protein n=1 Tax=Trichostrongylus colubriformis TaxID=6319 RepID=A0AAN8FKK2_TRICO